MLSKFTLAAIVFGIASLDEDYSPVGSAHDAFNTIIVLSVIFFGDKFARWLARK
jgi:hypothetical protein